MHRRSYRRQAAGVDEKACVDRLFGVARRAKRPRRFSPPGRRPRQCLKRELRPVHSADALDQAYLGLPGDLSSVSKPQRVMGLRSETSKSERWQMRVLAWPAFKNKAENPYNWLLYTNMTRLGVEVEEFSLKKLLNGKYAVLHVHQPESLLNDFRFARALARTGAFLLMLRLVRTRRTKVVWTMHNLRAHEGLYPTLEGIFWRAFVRQLDGHISLSELGEEIAVKRLPQLRALPGFVVPHGHYREVYPDVVSREEARLRLAIPSATKTLMFLGQIRPYKGIPHLIRTFRELTDPEAMLLVVGRPNSPSLAAEIEFEASLDPRVRLHLRFIPDEEVQTYLRAADLVVLPYQEIFNSGSALLALSFDRPIMVPSRGALGELRARVGDEWVKTYQGNLSPRGLGAAISWAVGTARHERAPLEPLDWKHLACITEQAYQAILLGQEAVS